MVKDKLADIYLPGESRAFVTGPGTRLEFRGGHAIARTPEDVRWALRQPRATLAPEPRVVDSVPQWCQGCGHTQPPVAQVTLPEGLTLGPAPEYALLPPPDALSEEALEALTAPDPPQAKRRA